MFLSTSLLILGSLLCSTSGHNIHIDLEKFAFKIVENLPNINKYRKEVDHVPSSHEEILKKFEEKHGVSLTFDADAGPDSFKPAVTIPEFGTARGRVMNTLEGKQFYSFQSIPFGKEPERFKMAEPFTDPWPQDMGDRGEYDATYLRAKCPQGSFVFPIASGREDCLHVSIYTPATFTGTSNYPVMFFIHGGAYYSGDASLYVPSRLMDRDGVVVVVVQYRLGTLGFLSTGTSDAPGNMGLMDQVLGLRWVQKYISYFGGNPDEVTVFGQSAGAASTSWMQMTPQTRAAHPDNNGKDLLKRIIPMSGSALEMWTLDTSPEDSFIMQADATDCNKGDTEASLQCMKDADLNTIVAGFLYVVTDDRENGGLGFAGVSPIIQNTDLDPNITIVIDKHPLRTISEGEALKVDVMAGSVRDEGSLVTGLLYGEFLQPNNFTDDAFFLAVEATPFFVHAFGIVDLTGAVANSFDMQFLNNTDRSDFASMSGGIVDLTGMLFLKTGGWSMSHMVSIYNTNNKVFHYSFEVESDDSIWVWMMGGSILNSPIEGGICHADDLLHFFYFPATMDAREMEAIKRHTTLWANFAKYSDPTPDQVDSPDDAWVDETEKWMPFTPMSLNYMLMQDNYTMQQDYKLRWNYNTIKYTEMEMARMEENERLHAELQKSNSEEEKAQDQIGGFKIAVAILGFLCAALVVFNLFLIWRG